MYRAFFTSSFWSHGMLTFCLHLSHLGSVASFNKYVDSMTRRQCSGGPSSQRRLGCLGHSWLLWLDQSSDFNFKDTSQAHEREAQKQRPISIYRCSAKEISSECCFEGMHWGDPLDSVYGNTSSHVRWRGGSWFDSTQHRDSSLCQDWVFFELLKKGCIAPSISATYGGWKKSCTS